MKTDYTLSLWLQLFLKPSFSLVSSLRGNVEALAVRGREDCLSANVVG